MSDRFLFDGKVVELVERPLFAETSFVERQSKIPLSEMTESDASAMSFLISLRRAGVMLTWADVQQMSPSDYELLPPDPAPAAVDEEPAEVPTPAGAEAGDVVTPSETSPDESADPATSTTSEMSTGY